MIVARKRHHPRSQIFSLPSPSPWFFGKKSKLEEQVFKWMMGIVELISASTTESDIDARVVWIVELAVGRAHDP